MLQLLVILYVVIYCPLIISVYYNLLKKYEDSKYLRADIPEKY